MGKFLESHKVLKLSQEGIENLPKPIKSDEIELVVKTLPTKKNIGPDRWFN